MKQTPQWLQDLQESAWELELLISGGAIFSLIQASEFFATQITSLKVTNDLAGANMLLIMGSFGIQVLTLGFILHLMLRAFWVALVCANYVYPQGVTTRRIGWKKPFKIEITEGADLFELILKVNRFCSIVMYLSLISCFLVAGIMAICFLLLTVPAIAGLHQLAIYPFYTALVVGLVFLYIADLLLFGLLRKTPVLAYVVYLPFRFFDIISLRFVYQRALWLYNTNVSRWRFMLVTAVFLAGAFIYSYAAIYRTMRWRNIFDQREYRWQMAPGPELNNNYYRDEAGNEKVGSAQIPSKLISQDYMELFLLYRKEYDYAMSASGKSRSYISDLAEVYIDDSLYQNLTWHPTWHTENDQLGITTLLPVKQLAPGAHELTLTSSADTSRVLIIPFWKEEK